MEFEILSEITDIETIATGRGVYIRQHLEKVYGKGRWRKKKGISTVRFAEVPQVRLKYIGMKHMV